MKTKELEKFGNNWEIKGFITGNAIETIYVFFPNHDENDDGSLLDEDKIQFIHVDDEELQQIFKQMDVLDITNSQKVVLRKSQRQLGQRVSWAVFRRDNYTCCYCGKNDVPLTVDHIILWEEGGASVMENLNTSCSRCNKTRGSMPYVDWLISDYYIQNQKNLQQHGINQQRWRDANATERVKVKSR